MKKVLITGGSEGIGLALAHCFAQEGCHLVLCARDMLKLTEAKRELQSVSHCKVDVIPLDLCDEDACRILHEKAGDIDVLVNNAGMGSNGYSWTIPDDHDRRLLMLNCGAMMSLTKLYLKDMITRGNGTILNIASTGAFQPGPYIASYYASKSFVMEYTRAAAAEAKEYGVRVCCACPGPVDTGFYAKYGGRKPLWVMPADKCAALIYKHMNEKTVIVPGFLNRMALLLPQNLRMRFVASDKKRKLRKNK
jgi:short-subunit dehydrogenase